MIEGDYIKTPNFHITMGKLCVDNQGNPAISVKRGKKNEYEIVPIFTLVNALLQAKKILKINNCSK